MKTVISSSKSGEFGYSEDEIDRLADAWADAVIGEIRTRNAARAAEREAARLAETTQPKDESEKK